MGGILGPAYDHSERNSNCPAASGRRRYAEFRVRAQRWRCRDGAGRNPGCCGAPVIRALCIRDVGSRALLRSGMLASSGLHSRRGDSSANSRPAADRKFSRSFAARWRASARINSLRSLVRELPETNQELRKRPARGEDRWYIAAIGRSHLTRRDNRSPVRQVASHSFLVLNRTSYAGQILFTQSPTEAISVQFEADLNT